MTDQEYQEEVRAYMYEVQTMADYIMHINRMLYDNYINLIYSPNPKTQEI